MKAFTINEGNITVFPSRDAAEKNRPHTDATVFTTAVGLKAYLKGFPVTAAVEIWNSMTGVTPVTKFKDRDTAVSRIWKAIQTLEPTTGATPEPVAETEPTVANEGSEAELSVEPETLPEHETVAADVAPQTPAVAPTEAPAQKKATRAKKTSLEPAGAKVPRENTKTSLVIGMLKAEGGTTLEEIMTATGWLKHTTRAMLSAGGSLTKKHGLAVTSEKVGDRRVYSIKG